MTPKLSDETRQILIRAAEESRNLHHEYIGTEHLLLALLTDAPTVAALAHFQLTPEQIRAQIASLIQPGPANAPTLTTPPVTPRAQRSLDLASEEIAIANQSKTEPPHLLLGLFREDHGIAGLTLRALSPTLTIESLREQIFRIRLAQLRLIERTVRPLRAATPRKLKMREELLAHLESIYAEELARTQNPDAALSAAANRFGNPADLTRELQSTVPFIERFLAPLGKRFGWRRPEHASRFLLRFSLQLLAFFGFLFAAEFALLFCVRGSDIYSSVYPTLLTLLTITLALNLLGNLYFLTRDALFGVFGSSKSLRRVALLSGATFFTTILIGVAFITASTGSLQELPRTAPALALAASLITIASLLHARLDGPREIQQTHWECLDLDTSS